MKYIITDTKLLELMNGYLDGQVVNNVSRVDSYILLFDKYNDDVNWDGILLEYDNNDGRLYIHNHFINDFYTIFPVGKDNLEEFIKDWFESRFHVKVNYVTLSS
jgi:hypothetical protein